MKIRNEANWNLIRKAKSIITEYEFSLQELGFVKTTT